MSGIETIAYAGKTPWHNLGVKVDNGYVSPSEFMQAAGLDWKVNKEDLYLADGTKVEGSQVTRRDSDGKILGVVGNRYSCLQNEDAFNWFAPFIDSKSAYFETAGALKEGKVIWVLAKTAINGEVTKGDNIESYILLSHSHDGTLSIRSGFVPVRVCCANTLAAAHKSASSKLLKIKHTKSAILALEKVAEIMDIAQLDFKATINQYKFLASKGVKKSDIEKYVTLVFGKEDESGDVKEIRESTIEKIQMIYETGRGMSETPDSMFKMYNAVNEYMNYYQGRSDSNRLHSLWFGANALTNEKALQIVTNMATGKM